MESLGELLATFRFKESPVFKYRSVRVGTKIRTLAIPNDSMRRLHRRLLVRLREISDLDLWLRSSYGALRGGSVVHNAANHCHNRYVYGFDLRDAYPSTSLEWLAQSLYLLDPHLGDICEIEAFLLSFCSGKCGGLAVGAPASPALFDLYCAVMVDEAIRQFCPRAQYSRYLDDLTISSPSPIPSELRRRVRSAALAAGYSVNRKKSWLVDRLYQPFGKPLTITGVVVTRQGEVRPSCDFVSATHQLLRRKKEHLSGSDWGRLRGMAGYLNQFTPPSHRSEREDVDLLIDWEVSADIRHLQCKLANRLSRIQASAVIQRRPAPLQFSRQYLDELRALAPIELVARRYIRALRRYGNEFVAPCPFHQERTASLTLVPSKGFYHCFGCGANGDVFTLVMGLENCSFPDAVRSLAAEYW